jgi:cytochrome c oxidase assembly protein subunit 15
MARVAVAAALLLVGVGGVVTSTGAGLAVADWPNTFGHNMFLYPLARMTGGIYYEHAHRLIGALVGLTTIVLAIVLQSGDERRAVRRAAWVAVALVVVQGVLGGMRVTGRLTLDSAAEAMRPALILAVVHGALAQIFLGFLVGLACVTSPAWQALRGRSVRPGQATDRRLGGILMAALLVQLVLGGITRHYDLLVLPHIVFGIVVVAPLAMHAGFRSWGLPAGEPILQRLGLALAGAVFVQVALGFAAFVVRGAAASGGASPAAEALATTLHQWFGAILLSIAVAWSCWTRRIGAPGPSVRAA